MTGTPHITQQASKTTALQVTQHALEAPVHRRKVERSNTWPRRGSFELPFLAQKLPDRPWSGDPRLLLAESRMAPLILDEQQRENVRKSCVSLDCSIQMRRLQEMNGERWMKRRQLGKRTRFTAEKKQLIRTWFKLLDVDENGEISVKEMSDALLSSGCAESTQQIRGLMARLDINGDGVVDFDEFLRVFKSANSLDDEWCADRLKETVKHLRDTMKAVDCKKQLAPSLAVSIAKRRSVLELMKNVYGNGNDTVSIVDQVEKARRDRDRALRTQNKKDIRKATTVLMSLEKEKVDLKQRLQFLSLLCPDASTNPRPRPGNNQEGVSLPWLR